MPFAPSSVLLVGVLTSSVCRSWIFRFTACSVHLRSCPWQCESTIYDEVGPAIEAGDGMRKPHENRACMSLPSSCFLLTCLLQLGQVDQAFWYSIAHHRLIFFLNALGQHYTQCSYIPLIFPLSIRDCHCNLLRSMRQS